MVPNQPPSLAGDAIPTGTQADSNETRSTGIAFSSFNGFDHERRTYEEHKSELLRDHEGRYVVIQGDDLVAIRKTYEDALEAGYCQFGLEPFYVKEILKEDPVVLVTRFVLPCPI